MNLYAFLITTLAGLSTMLGSLGMFISKRKNTNIICFCLSFSAGVMISVSLFDLFPNSYLLLNNTFTSFGTILICLISINIGVIITMLIDNYLPENKGNYSDKKLYRVGIISMLAIIIHNIPEGIATFCTSATNIKLGIKLSLAIAMHNIPEGISIALPIFYSTNNKKKALCYTFISGISELFGSIIAYLFLKPFINDNVMGILYSIICGIMLSISLKKLLPESKKYNNMKLTIISFIIGVAVMILSHMIIE